MENKKSYIPLKVFISYLLLVLLFGSVGWFLYTENQNFSKNEKRFGNKNSSLLKVSTILSDLYKTESLARIAIQSESNKDFDKYVLKTKTLQTDIDSLKTIVSTEYQKTLLDSVQLLLTRKIKNIQELKTIKSKSEDENAVSNAITDLTKIQSSMRKLQMEDFVKSPASMANYERNVLKKYVDYLNQNIPDDSTNTLTKKESDSIVSVSKMLLNEVKKETANKKKRLNSEETKLIQNEILISDQLRKVFGIIEREIILNTTSSYLAREKSLKKTNQIVTTAAAIGLLLTLFFLILIISDFSKTQSYKTQLEMANLKAKKLLTSREQLISTVSHDLKTPLSTIIGYTELLGNSELNTKQQHFTKNIKGSSSYISKLVQDLLDFTQIEAGKITIDTVPFSLADVINEVASSIQAVYSQKPIDLSITIDEKLQQKIIGDPFRLRQILSNIIGNAFKFTEKGFIKIDGKVNLETQTLTLSIKDSGIGIDEKSQQLVFEEFTQADEKIEKKYGGTGLGLTISKKMAAILGGALSLESEIGKGSTFTIQLPLVFDNTAIEENLSSIDKTQYRAVIIDDDQSLLQLTTEVLRQNDFIIFPFDKATEALLWIEKNAFDFIITDIQMPVMDGFSFLKELQIKSYPEYKNQPVFAVTGRGDLDLDYYKQAGFTTVIRKPYTPKTILTTIKAILNNTVIPKEFATTNSSKNHNKGYSLKALKAFLSDDKNALEEILQSFMIDAKENLLSLEEAILAVNFQEIKNIAHKMNPMFKQIKAFEISAILDELELKDENLAELKSKISTLKSKIEILFKLIQKDKTN
ncbi:response regulator [Flavobacterium sp. P4023]|uniref:histidine kinase n=1 Tax=Flavobacterium flabelliforme TaxID=2816119 RepID=A0ABS5CQK6_9FLAO|nr:ATP-binding protein [Flavobacterium flabelliforme]MBP4140907.1 response regulator [Flavobacterium flabelliforme]